MKYCNGNKYNFMLVFNDPFISFAPISEVFSPSSHTKPVSYPINDFNKEEMESLMTNVRIGRLVKNLQENQKYMMGFTWVIPSELRLFESFQNIIMVDTVEKTNNDKRALLTAGVKDSNGKMFIFSLFHAKSTKLDVSMVF